jgi:carbonic anhydrase
VAGLGGFIALSAFPFASDRPAFAAEEMAGVSPDEALKTLMEGNARYMASHPEHPDQSAERRETVAKSQHPIAVVLGCSDSRVAPELVFDQGLGDLFTIRVAGNVADDAVVASIEYAVEHLGATLVMVLGHERCGAVVAAVDLVKDGGTAPGHLAALIDPIRPAVAQANAQGGDVVDTAVIANVGNVTAQLKLSEPVLAEMIHHEKIKVVGARYDLETGEVVVVA